MKKYIFYIIGLIATLFIFDASFADIINIPYSPDIRDVSIEYRWGFGGSLVDSANSLGFSLLNTLKVVLSGIFLVYIVYIGIQMIMSMWDDGEDLSAAKRQISYMLIAVVFINIPGTLYEAFYNVERGGIWEISGTWSDEGIANNIFINSGALINSINAIIGFMEALIFGIAIMMLVIAGIEVITGWSDEEDRKNAIQKIVWSIVALIFVWFIELWQSIVISGNISGTQSIGGIFGSLIDIALFWAAPTALLFLTLAGYYYITANDDEERMKKAKNIVLYTAIATVLLLSIFTFLIDLANLF